jgi:hypothetical protein
MAPRPWSNTASPLPPPHDTMSTHSITPRVLIMTHLSFRFPAYAFGIPYAAFFLLMHIILRALITG